MALKKQSIRKGIVVVVNGKVALVKTRMGYQYKPKQR